MRLMLKRFWWIWLLALVGVLWLFGTVFQLQQAERTTRVRAESQLLESFLQGSVAVLNRSLLTLDLLLTAQAAQASSSRASGGSPDVAALAVAWRAVLDQQLLVSDLVLVDARGQIVVAAKQGTARLGLSLPEGFLEAVRQEGAPVLRASAPTYNRVTAAHGIWFAKPVPGTDGAEIVLAEVPVSVLADMLSRGARHDHWDVTVERDDGVLLSTHHVAEPQLGRRIESPLSSLPADGRARRASARLDSEVALLAAKASLYPSVLLTVGVPEAELLAEADADRALDWRWAASLSVVVLGLAALLHRHLLGEARARAEMSSARAEVMRQHEALTEQVRAREAADAERRQAQARLDSAIDAMVEGFIVFGPDDRVVLFNRHYLEIFPNLRPVLRVGASIDELGEAAAAAVLPHGSEAERMAWRARRRLQPRTGDGQPVELVLADGRVIEMLESRTPDGGFVGVYRDVTEGRRAQRDLAQAKLTLDRALNAIDEGFLLFDRDDRLVTWNQHYAVLFPHLEPALRTGVPLVELQTLSARHLLPDGNPEIWARWIADRRRHHRGGGAPLEIVQPDGRVIEIAEAPTPEGGFVAVYRDVTETRRAQRELAEAMATLDQALNVMSDGFVVFDASERLLLWNERYLEMFPYYRGVVSVGLDSGEMARHAARTLYGDARDGEAAAFLAWSMRRDRGSDAAPRTLALPSGLVVEATDRRTSDGKRVSLYRDVTQERQSARALEEARDAAEAAARAKSQFLAAMSHEIRTPLNAVLGMNGLLMDSPLDPEQRHYVELIGKSGENLLAIINDILDLSRLESGKLTLEVVDFSLPAAISEVASMMATRAQVKGLKLDWPLGGDAPRVRGDPTRLRQVLFNLVGNAIKFTERGEVGIGLEIDDDEDGRVRAVLTVRDTGIGIDPEVLPHLFERFVQADNSTSRRFGGTGLGLAICREIVQLMGGRIDVRSAPGLGSVFRVHLSFARAAEPSVEADEHRVAAAQSRGRSLRILVAEDNGINQVLIRTLLGKLGHELDIAADGLEALRQVQAADYDLVLMDVQMPNMDGYDATRAIRELPGPCSRIPIVAMTANVMSEDREACVQAGMNGFVGKPIDPKRLRQAIEDVMADKDADVAA